MSCTHVESVELVELPADIPGCEDCLRMGSTWVHLRMCAGCGHIGCCDNSPNRHARSHASEHSHPVIRSAEPNEDWFWCYVDELAFLVDG